MTPSGSPTRFRYEKLEVVARHPLAPLEGAGSDRRLVEGARHPRPGRDRHQGVGAEPERARRRVENGSVIHRRTVDRGDRRHRQSRKASQHHVLEQNLVLAFVLALSVPFLPVRQEATSLAWPQNNSLDNIEAPLVSYTPLSLRVSVPCSAAESLGEDGGTLVSTVPPGAPDATEGSAPRVEEEGED